MNVDEQWDDGDERGYEADEYELMVSASSRESKKKGEERRCI